MKVFLSILFTSILQLVILSGLFAQKWQPISSTDLKLKYSLEDPSLFEIDFSVLQQSLLSIKSGSKVEIDLPMPDGKLRSFEIEVNDVMPPALQAKFPEIRTYSMRSGRYYGRADMGVLGFHAMIFTPEGTCLIEPASESSKSLYLSYFTRDLKEELAEPFYCETDDGDGIDMEKLLEMDFAIRAQTMGMKSPEPVTLRTYRLTVSCTGEYTQRTGGTVQTAMAALTLQANRASGVFEREHAIKLVLVENNEVLVFTDPDTDPFTNTSLSAMLGQNITATNERIGFANYDVGHVMGTVGGGLAQLGSTCGNNKAAGATGQNQAPTGFLALMVFCHELGHQFGASHTFNLCRGDGNESPGTAFEPGSGSTIMAYAGLCGSNNVQVNTDEYYHAASLIQVRNFITVNNGATCAVTSETGNTHPEVQVTSPVGMTIPVGTPFQVNGHGFDNEGDELRYNWDQFDLGPQSDLGSPTGTAPLFRFEVPNFTSSRILPRIQLLATGGSDPGEILPSITRPINFRFVVRDNNPNGGGVTWAPYSLQASDLAGPFQVLNPVGQEEIQAGAIYEITWDVANTNQPPVNCQFVDIVMSRNAGFNYIDTLAVRLPNTGSAFVTMPAQPTNNGRIMVRANDNIFFNVTRNNFRLISPAEPTFSFRPTYTGDIICTPNTVEVPVSTLSLLGFEGQITFSIEPENVPQEAVFIFSQDTVEVGESLILKVDLEGYRGASSVDFHIVAIDTSGKDTLRFPVHLNVRNFLADEPVTVNPMPEAEGITPPILFEWEEVEGAEYYNFLLSTDPSFPSGTGTIVAQFLPGTTYTPAGALNANTLYYWKIEAVNICGEISTELPSVFHTEVLTCQEYEKDEDIVISATGTPIITSDITVPANLEITTIEIPRIHGTHQWFSDLDFFLFTPDGSELRLISRQCANFNGQFSFGLSDFSSSTFECPPNQNLTFKPDTPLSSVAGENAQGNWTLRIRDLRNGGGGRFNGWSMNLCSSSPASRPELQNNDPLVLQPGTARHINSNLLLTTDAEKPATELIYSLVTLPQFGVLRNGNVPILSVGETFTQEDINRVRIDYQHMTDREEEDGFYFLVRHNGGGFVGIQWYSIITDDDFTSTVRESFREDKVSLFPNPAGSLVNLVFESPIDQPIIQVFSVTGQLMQSMQWQGTFEQIQIQTSSLPPGAYFVTGNGNSFRFVKRFIKE